ncbi:ribokinase [Arthrobacter sp. MYb229]|uniref:1-phosphofructokinase family hexose kinase n=1 Tax=unclassified Arthrobacter TaxID=235627 RepID=UPI000CFC957F|nr:MULTISPECIES: PfkB family carbohydrate kinase [unclassified Arthrobacter]PRA02412.1 ribokinase [Arthrobacter sp. MYb229]PRB50645.1 ribokinase [Arthrobacter sp. MYb216]
MILSFTPNPAIDESYTVENLTLDSSHRVPLPTSQAGGKGINVARVLHSQHHPVLALSPTGGNSGIEFTENVLGSGLPFRSIPVTASTRRSMAFHDPQANTTTLFNQAGQALDDRQWKNILAAYAEALGAATAVNISGSWPPGTEPGLIGEFINLATARGCPVLVDATGPWLLQAARHHAVLKPNEYELREATGCQDLALGARKLIDLGATEVFLSAGARGIFRFSSATPAIGHAVLPRSLSGNPTGAGDSAVAAIMTGYLREQEPEFTLRLAVAWSASTVLMPTAGALAPAHQELFDEVEYQILPANAEI